MNTKREYMRLRCSGSECVRRIPAAARSWAGSTASNGHAPQLIAETVRALAALELEFDSQSGIVPEDATAVNPSMELIHNGYCGVSRSSLSFSIRLPSRRFPIG